MPVDQCQERSLALRLPVPVRVDLHPWALGGQWAVTAQGKCIVTCNVFADRETAREVGLALALHLGVALTERA